MDSSISAPPPSAPPDDPLNALLNIPDDDDDAADTKKAIAAKMPESPLSTVETRGPKDSADVKPEPMVKTEPQESIALKEAKGRPVPLSIDTTPTKASPEDVITNFDVAVKRMAGELKVSILWDRSHKYFPGLRTVVQFKLVG